MRQCSIKVKEQNTDVKFYKETIDPSIRELHSKIQIIQSLRIQAQGVGYTFVKRSMTYKMLKKKKWLFQGHKDLDYSNKMLWDYLRILLMHKNVPNTNSRKMFRKKQNEEKLMLFKNLHLSKIDLSILVTILSLIIWSGQKSNQTSKFQVSTICTISLSNLSESIHYLLFVSNNWQL